MDLLVSRFGTYNFRLFHSFCCSGLEGIAGFYLWTIDDHLGDCDSSWVFFLALAVLSDTREGPKKLYGLMWLAVISVSTGYFLFTIDILVEQVHLMEYGILGWLYYLPLRKIISNRLVFITA